MSSDEKALEEFDKSVLDYESDDSFNLLSAVRAKYGDVAVEDLLENIKTFILKTRQEAREEERQLLDTHTENETKAHKPNTCACPCHNVQPRLYSL